MFDTFLIYLFICLFMYSIIHVFIIYLLIYIFNCFSVCLLIFSCKNVLKMFNGRAHHCSTFGPSTSFDTL